MFVLLLLGVLACSNPTAPEEGGEPAGESTFPTSEIGSAVVARTNEERIRAGLPGLAESARLMQAAQLHAEQMARAGRLDHVLNDAPHPRPEDRLSAVQYRWQAWAENVAFGQRTADEVVSGWMRSPGHRANILHGTVTEMGAGYARDASGRPYWVQVFGKPI
jgi:uncharacterized protein YkwD